MSYGRLPMPLGHLPMSYGRLPVVLRTLADVLRTLASCLTDACRCLTDACQLSYGRLPVVLRTLASCLTDACRCLTDAPSSHLPRPSYNLFSSITMPVKSQSRSRNWASEYSLVFYWICLHKKARRKRKTLLGF